MSATEATEETEMLEKEATEEAEVNFLCAFHFICFFLILYTLFKLCLGHFFLHLSLLLVFSIFLIML